jgi:hypothetical protein
VTDNGRHKLETEIREDYKAAKRQVYKDDGRGPFSQLTVMMLWFIREQELWRARRAYRDG